MSPTHSKGNGPIQRGQSVVVLRRMDALREAIVRRDWENVEWHYDNTRSAVERAFGTRVRAGFNDEEEGDEMFTFGHYRWNVSEAWKLVADGRPASPVPTSQLATMLSLLGVDEEHAKTVDLSRPLIIAMHPLEPQSGIVIDGWHRIHRALSEDVKELPAYSLTRAESERVRVQ